jgi:hypothetical protein
MPSVTHGLFPNSHQRLPLAIRTMAPNELRVSALLLPLTALKPLSIHSSIPLLPMPSSEAPEGKTKSKDSIIPLSMSEEPSSPSLSFLSPLSISRAHLWLALRTQLLTHGPTH